jgi:asparagine synthase (glutamine-hydrolysing)
LVSERPIGAFLSGGIDSTIVTALMQEESESRVHSFSIGFSDPKFDESRLSRQIAEVIGTIHHEKVIQPQPELILNELGKMLDQPFADSSIIPTYLLSKFAKEKLVVALSGDGGDEAFAGYERYRAGLLLNTINPILALNPSRFLPTNRVENQRIRKLLKHSDKKTPKERYRGFQTLLENRDISYLLNPELFGHNVSDYFELIWNSLSTENLLRKMQEMDFKTYLPGDLMYKVDISSMANGLEVRSPFLDFRVVEFGLSLPNRFKIRNGESKFILREIAKKHAPAKFMNRPKMGFAIPRGRWLREELRTMVWDVLLDDTSKNRGWYQQENLKKLLIRHQSGIQLDSIIWPIFMLELWARNWID